MIFFESLYLHFIEVKENLVSLCCTFGRYITLSHRCLRIYMILMLNLASNVLRANISYALIFAMHFLLCVSFCYFSFLIKCYELEILKQLHAFNEFIVSKAKNKNLFVCPLPTYSPQKGPTQKILLPLLQIFFIFLLFFCQDKLFSLESNVFSFKP